MKKTIVFLLAMLMLTLTACGEPAKEPAKGNHVTDYKVDVPEGFTSIEQEGVLERTWQNYRDCDAEYRQRKAEGITITDAMVYQNGLRVLERDIQRETDKLEELRKQEEAKRQEVVDAKIDTSSIEKLKEHKLEDYYKAVQKDEEKLIDEFVSSARVRANIGA